MPGRGRAITNARPGGTPIAFCDAVRATSTPQSVICSASPATEQTPSTTVSTPADWAGLASPATSVNTPVDVSTCVIVITL